MAELSAQEAHDVFAKSELLGEHIDTFLFDTPDGTDILQSDIIDGVFYILGIRPGRQAAFAYGTCDCSFLFDTLEECNEQVQQWFIRALADAKLMTQWNDELNGCVLLPVAE